jgi:TolB-like protein
LPDPDARGDAPDLAALPPEATAAAAPPAYRRWSPLVGALAILALLVVGWRLVARDTASASTRVQVAVLPLVRFDPAGESKSDALADSVTDGLIAALARRPGLEVASRTTVMQYRDLRASLAAIGADLGVQAIVEGRVQLTGTRLWVEVRLVDARRDRKLWVDDFAGDTADQRGLERRVAAAIGDAIAARFGPAVPVE